MIEVCGDGLTEEAVGVLVLLSAGFDGGQEPFDEVAAVVALGAEGEVFPVSDSLRRSGSRLTSMQVVLGETFWATHRFRQLP